MKRNDPLFHPPRSEAAEVFDRALKLYTEYFFPLELPLYYSSPSWLQARRVLDIGTGNGAYLAQLSTWFPDKEYKGIDRDPTMVEVAKQRHARERMAFSCVDFMDASAEYDYLLFRFVAQHVVDIPGLLRKAAEITTGNGAILLIDSWKGSYHYEPDVPLLRGLMDTFREHRLQHGANYDVMSGIEHLIADQPHWHVRRAGEILVPTTIPGHLAILRDMERETIEFLAATGVVDVDFAAVRAEWDRWCNSEHVYAHEGLRVLELSKRDGA
jgi:SAM-dependent methyltransferase